MILMVVSADHSCIMCNMNTKNTKDKDLRKIEKIKAEIAKLQRQLELEEQPKMKKVKNLMTGKEIEIREDTPYCCDPSTELYWTM